MMLRSVLIALLAASAIATAARAQDALVTYKALSPELALDCARAALNECRTRGFQVGVAVVDRFGLTQVTLRDRFAGAHTIPTATGKAWTAATFRTATTDLQNLSQPGSALSGLRSVPGALILGGAITIDAAGSLVGAIGVSGAPGGDIDEACAKAGIDAIRERLDF